MNLGQLQKLLRPLSNESFRFKYCIGAPMSYRGTYAEVAFEPEYNLTVHEVKENVRRAMTKSFTGYKGGEYVYDEHTTCHSAYYGDWDENSEDQFESLVMKMLLEYHENN